MGIDALSECPVFGIQLRPVLVFFREPTMSNLTPTHPSFAPRSASAATWIITGGAGFIGSNLVRTILRTRPDVRVVVLDKLTYAGSLENLRDLPKHSLLEPADHESGFEFVRADIANELDVQRAFETYRPQCVLNLAAETHVDRSIDSPGDFVETNVRGTFELLEASRKLVSALPSEAGRNFRFLQVSTDEVFGSLGREGFFTEETPYAPNSPYSASKASADMLVRAYHQTYGLPTLTTHCSNNYGAFQLPEKLIPLMVLNALEGKSLPIYGDGGNVRDWIFVEDHCSGILRTLENGVPGDRYAFGGNCERSNLEVVDAVCDALEALRPAKENSALVSKGIESYKGLKTFVEDRPGHDRRYAIDSSKVARDLGWVPVHRFEDGLAETVGWYTENEAWRTAIQRENDLRSRQGLKGIETGETEGAGSVGGR